MSPWIDQSDMGRRRADRGEVMCEACEAWVAEYVPTLDDVYLCLPCAKESPEATPEELAEYFDEDEVAEILRQRMGPA